MLGSVHELDPHVMLNYYYTALGVWKTLMAQNSLGISRSNFQLLYKKINYQYLTIFD